MCRLEFHQKCYGLKHEDLQNVGGDCNFQFVCDSCIALYKPIYPTFINNAKEEIASIKQMLLAIRRAVEPPPANDTSKMHSEIHEMVKGGNALEFGFRNEQNVAKYSECC